MLDQRTLFAALAISLLGCSRGTPPADAPSDAKEAPQFPDGDMAAPPPDAAPAADAPPTGAAPAADGKPADAAPVLPAGRPEPLPPKDKKPVVAKDKSVRNGAAACCGEGTCGDCAPLPAGRKEPIPPKDGKPVPASKSARKGAAACCGEGTCAAC